MRPRSGDSREGGQALVFLALSMTVVLRRDGDGHRRWQCHGAAAQHAECHGRGRARWCTVPSREDMGGDRRVDSDVRSAMQSAFSNNEATMGTSYYVDYAFNVVGNGRARRLHSQRCRRSPAVGNRTFDTFLAGAIGMTTDDIWSRGHGIGWGVAQHLFRRRRLRRDAGHVLDPDHHLRRLEPPAANWRRLAAGREEIARPTGRRPLRVDRAAVQERSRRGRLARYGLRWQPQERDRRTRATARSIFRRGCTRPAEYERRRERRSTTSTRAR